MREFHGFLEDNPLNTFKQGRGSERALVRPVGADVVCNRDVTLRLTSNVLSSMTDNGRLDIATELI